MRAVQEFLKRLATYSFWFIEYLMKKTHNADVFKGQKQKISYREGIQILKSKKPIMSHKYPA